MPSCFMRSELLLAALVVAGCSHTRRSAGLGADVSGGERVCAGRAAFARDHRSVLADEARVRFLAIPRLDVPDLDELPDDPRANREVAERFARAREFVMGWGKTPADGERLRERLIDSLAAPRPVRLNDDPAHPVLALPRPADLFVIWFDRTPSDFVLPGQLWDVRPIFLLVRAVIEARSHPAALALIAIFDQVAPPTITRANGDPDHPVLALVESGKALVVSLRLSEESGYAIASVRYAGR
jgi:hypothetical protein